MKKTVISKCPYCHGNLIYKRYEDVFPYYDTREQKQNMLCMCENYPDCDAYVMFSSEDSDNVPVGIPANHEVRRLRWITHNYFDLLWKTGIMPNRSVAYKWLSKKVHTSNEYCHIRCFNERLCVDTIIESTQFLSKNFQHIKTYDKLNDKELNKLKDALMFPAFTDNPGCLKRLICLVFDWSFNKIIKIDTDNHQVYLSYDPMNKIKVSFSPNGNIIQKLKTFAYNYCYGNYSHTE